MNKFINREGLNLNRKELVVVSIERDTSGEIISLVVDEARCDNDIIKEGTKLEAMELNTIVRNMILEELNITDLERVTYDKDALSIPLEASSNFDLISVGEKGTHITWEKVDGTGIDIIGNVATVERTEIDQTSTLKATLDFGSVTETKEFEIKVPSLQLFTPESFQTTWTRTAGSTKLSTFYVESSNSLPLSLEAVDVSNGLLIDLFFNNSTSVMVGIRETEAHNIIVGTGSMLLTCKINVYGDSNKQNLLGTIPCTITYKY